MSQPTTSKWLTDAGLPRTPRRPEAGVPTSALRPLRVLRAEGQANAARASHRGCRSAARRALAPAHRPRAEQVQPRHHVETSEQRVAGAAVERAVDRHVRHAAMRSRRARSAGNRTHVLELVVALRQAAVAVDHAAPSARARSTCTACCRRSRPAPGTRRARRRRARERAVDRRRLGQTGPSGSTGQTLTTLAATAAPKTARADGARRPAIRPPHAEPGQHRQAERHQHAEARRHPQAARSARTSRRDSG